jgi:antitoxin HigA-1
MLMIKRKPATAGEILVQEFIEPMGRVGQGHGRAAPAGQRAVQQPQAVTNVQRRSDLWEAMHSPGERERIKRARPLVAAA